ncbi:hypothetical protein [Nocardia sp. SYP-A9097]|nr:hypothetical protein [Nocardia sp. SYP-A9097]
MDGVTPGDPRRRLSPIVLCPSAMLPVIGHMAPAIPLMREIRS